MGLFRFLVRADELANEDLMNGRAGQTISARLGGIIVRNADGNPEPGDGKMLMLAGLVNAMPWFGAKHCVAEYRKWAAANPDKL